MKPTIIAIGTVKSSKVVEGKSKPFLAVKIDCPAIAYGEGKSFTPRCEARVRYKYESLDLQPGDFVVAKGEANAETFEHQGKTYANLIVDRAEIQHVALPVREVERGTFGQDKAEEATLPKAKPMVATAQQEDDTEVPF